MAIDAEIVERVAVGIVLARIELGDEEQFLVGGHRRFERGDRFLAADEQGNDAVRENDDVAKRKDGERASHGQYMGGPPSRRNKGQEHSPPPLALAQQARRRAMADDREKISTGPNEEPINETIAGTGPGIADDALAPGEELPEAPSDEEVERMAEKLGAPTAEKDTLPLEGE